MTVGETTTLLSTGDIIARSVYYIVTCISLIGTTMVASSVVRSETNRKNIQQRIMLCISISDMLYCILVLTGMLMAPKNWAEGNLGNRVTCNIQGFLLTIAWASSCFYNCCLATYYLLLIKYNWSDRRLRKIQMWFYIVPPANTMTSAILGLIFDSYFIKVEPLDACFPTADLVFLEGFVGGKRFYIFAAGIFVYVSMVSFNMWCIVVIYCHVRAIEKKTLLWDQRASLAITRSQGTRQDEMQVPRRSTFLSSTFLRWSRRDKTQVSSRSNLLKKTKQVAVQFLLFAMAFLIPSFVQITTFFLAFAGVESPAWVIQLVVILLSTTGFFNTLIYFRLRFVRMREDNPSWRNGSIVGHILKEVLFLNCNCCKTKQAARPTSNLEDCEPILEDDTEISRVEGGGNNDHMNLEEENHSLGEETLGDDTNKQTRKTKNASTEGNANVLSEEPLEDTTNESIHGKESIIRDT